MEGYGFRLEEALNWLCWFTSVASEVVLDEADFRSLCDQLVHIKGSLETLQLQIFERKRALDAEAFHCQGEQGSVGRPYLIITCH